jgi:hypothetical protein
MRVSFENDLFVLAAGNGAPGVGVGGKNTNYTYFRLEYIKCNAACQATNPNDVGNPPNRINHSLYIGKEKFCGSPSFRINGEDLWCEERAKYHLSCRVYRTAQGLQGSPTVEMLRERILTHLQS